MAAEVEDRVEPVQMSAFAQGQFLSKYSHTKEDGSKETWEEMAERVSSNVLGALEFSPGDPEIRRLQELIRSRKFILGGRYLANAGKEYHTVNNCFLYRCEDSREGWADLVRKAIMALTSGGGIGVDYSSVRPRGLPITKTGGIAGGPVDPMQMVNEIARHVMSAGSRRSAVWAGLNWAHPDLMSMIKLKDWSPEVLALKEKDFSFPAPLDMTNISVQLDDVFFEAYFDAEHEQNVLAHEVYDFSLAHMLKHGEPGFSIDVRQNAQETLRNAPVSGSTHVLLEDGYCQVNEIVGQPVSIWTGMRWAHDVVFERTMKDAETVEVSMTGGRSIRCEPSHEFLVEDWQGTRHKLEGIRRIAAIDLRPDMRLHVAPPSLDDDSHQAPVKVLSISPSAKEDVFCADVKVPEHSFMAEGVIVSNCTEVTSEDDSDVCNLGSLNMARFDTLEEFEDAIPSAVLALLAGTVYSDLPHDEIHETRKKNRRLGLGLMGIHEWLLKRGYRYEVTDELHRWLQAYATISDDASRRYARAFGLSEPVKVRAIAPTGTLSIVAETTSGIEPIFCVAQKRRWLADDKRWKSIYMINPTAERLIDEEGIAPEAIEDAYALSYDIERRIKFQAQVQKYVDHGISSTLNLPYPIVDQGEVDDFGVMLMQYLPYLRGITAYPDGARSGQPLTAVPYEVARSHGDVIFEENEDDSCKSGVCGV